jgi:oxygen-dependent protoporphyrinogen oxidase
VFAAMTNATSSGRRVAVLGAGLSGLRAAFELDRRGFDVTVLESRADVGGRAGGEWCAGHWMDAAWPIVGGRDASLVRWARDLGLGDSLFPLRPVQTTLRSGGETRPVDGLSLRSAARIPGPRIWERPKLLRWNRLMARYARQLDPMFPERAADLDYRSLRDHVALYFGKGNLEYWLAPEVYGDYGDSVDSMSRVALLHRAQSLGIGERRPSSPGLPRRPLLELAQATAERLDIRRGTVVHRIDEQPAGGFDIEATNSAGENEDAHFDAAVVALGPAQAAEISSALLTPAERDFFDAVAMRSVVTLSVAIEGVEGGLPTDLRMPRSEGSAISCVVIEPGQPGGRVPEGRSQVVAVARDVFADRWRDMANDVIAKNLTSSLEQIMPGVRDRILTTRLNRSTAPAFEVGSYRRLATFQKVQRDRRALGRRLYWAGDYLSTGGFEAASLSGLRAANALDGDSDLLPGPALESPAS